MAANGAPPKPWEINRGQSPSNNLRSSSLTRPESGEFPTPPPIPARPNQQSTSATMYRPTYGNLGSYGGGYNFGGYGGYGSGMYGSSGLYGTGGGMYGSSYRNYGTPPNGVGSFTQQAEDSTRQAFQSVESIVRAFTSVSAMLESTFGAVYSSFRAVLDVADHFSRVRSTFSEILSSIAIFRLFRYLYRRVLAIFGSRECEDAWSNAAVDGALMRPNSSSQKKSWPIMLFAAVVMGGPYLIWRLMRGANSQKPANISWMNGDGDHVVAKAEFDFSSESEEEISFLAGDTIILAPRAQQPHIRGWLLGTIDGKNPGYLPANYVKILGLRRGRAKPTTPPTPAANISTTTTTTPPAGLSTEGTVSNEEWQNIHSGSERLGPPEEPPTQQS
uniref:peroxisomal membrane protein PEX13 n=1 Tax=Ciona intestinalis TaxID=7719 RepID=UPI000180CB65|nr:peroxisomal membrane protein PEX13 [Ciona intestinalis]|eukprot:XP_002123483.1 peroxisomal membrane protein PEX13 [Ciona intestinalis]